MCWCWTGSVEWGFRAYFAFCSQNDANESCGLLNQHILSRNVHRKLEHMLLARTTAFFFLFFFSRCEFHASILYSKQIFKICSTLGFSSLWNEQNTQHRAKQEAILVIVIVLSTGIELLYWRTKITSSLLNLQGNKPSRSGTDTAHTGLVLFLVSSNKSSFFH